MREDWENLPLDKACKVEYGTRVVKKKDEGTIYPVYGGGGATFYIDKYNRDNRMVISRFAMSEQCTRFVSGKFFLNDSGLTISPKNEVDIEKQFLNYQILSLNDQIYSLGRGTAQRNLNVDAFKKLKIKYPDNKLEQKRIVAILDEAFEAIDHAKANVEKNIKNAEELFQSKLNEVFSQNGEGWTDSKLKKITTKIGSGATPRGGKKSYKESGISLIRSMNVYDEGFKENKLAFIDEEQADKLSNVEILKGDVLLNITGASVARCCVVPEEYLPARVNQHVSIIRLKEGVMDERLLHFALISKPNKEKLLGIGEQGSTRQAITKKQIQNYLISYPTDFKQQRKIIHKLNNYRRVSNKLIEQYTSKFNSLEELKKSILQKAFSGELTAKEQVAV